MNRELFHKVIVTTKKLTILYVEDEEFVLSVVTEMLDNLFLKVDVAKDGEEALIKFQNNSYDLFLTFS